MQDTNNLTLIGRISRDVEFKGGVANMSIAFNTYSKEGDVANFIDIKAFGHTATFCDKWIKKGTQVSITGKLHQEKWTSADGINKTKIVIHVDNMQMIGGKKDDNTQSERAGNTIHTRQTERTNAQYDGEDVPF